MRKLVALSLIACACVAPADRLGKTDAQIRKMGRDGWSEFYMSRRTEPSTTATGCDADEVYGEVLERRNNRLMAKLPSTQRSAFRKIRYLLGTLAEDMVGVAQTMNGVGFLWRTQVSAAISADTEEALYHSLTAGSKLAKRTSPKGVEGVFHAFALNMKLKARDMAKGVGDWSTKYGSPEGALEELESARSTFRKIAAMCAEQPPIKANPLIQRCFDCIESAAEYAHY